MPELENVERSGADEVGGVSTEQLSRGRVGERMVPVVSVASMPSVMLSVMASRNWRE